MAKPEHTKPDAAQKPGFGAGSEGWDGSEDPSRPVMSSAEQLAAAAEADGGSTDLADAKRTMQSDYALSGADPDAAEQTGDDGGFSVAEEQNFDQQSQAARRVGRAAPEAGGAPR